MSFYCRDFCDCSDDYLSAYKKIVHTTHSLARNMYLGRGLFEPASMLEVALNSLIADKPIDLPEEGGFCEEFRALQVRVRPRATAEYPLMWPAACPRIARPLSTR